LLGEFQVAPSFLAAAGNALDQSSKLGLSNTATVVHDRAVVIHHYLSPHVLSFFCDRDANQGRIELLVEETLRILAPIVKAIH
jgi:hypothetical protein